MKRYDVHIERVVLGTGVSYAKTVAHENPTGTYTTYDEANARIAELTAEVARLREALVEITRGLNADARSQVIARNALREGD